MAQEMPIPHCVHGVPLSGAVRHKCFLSASILASLAPLLIVSYPVDLPLTSLSCYLYPLAISSQCPAGHPLPETCSQWSFLPFPVLFVATFFLSPLTALTVCPFQPPPAEPLNESLPAPSPTSQHHVLVLVLPNYGDDFFFRSNKTRKFEISLHFLVLLLGQDIFIAIHIYY